MVATLLFTYHRFEHTKRVVEALELNTVLPEKLIIFQDGVKETTNLDEWNKVNNYLKNIDFCKKEIVVSRCNKGLARSIVDGIDYAFENYDKVVILEDDCIPAVDFINFMEQALNQYEKKKDVWSISGYAWPLELEEDEYDVYFTGRASSWGWGTWKDRWKFYKQDFSVMSRISEKKETNQNLFRWGKDLEPMLNARKEGKNDSWAVFWALIIIENSGKCVAPYRSLITNIGNDGSGEHCGITNKFDSILSEQRNVDYSFPTEIAFNERICERFTTLFGSKFVKYCNEKRSSSVLIYGAGNFMRENDFIIYDMYNVLAIIDQNKYGYYGCVPIIKMDQINRYNYNKIIIMIQNESICREVKDRLIEDYDVSEKKIEFGKDVLGR